MLDDDGIIAVYEALFTSGVYLEGY